MLIMYTLDVCKSTALYIQVRLYKWEEGELVLECSYNDTILALFIKCKGDFVLVRYSTI